MFCTIIYLTDANSIEQCQLTEQELRQLHRRFGHPLTDRLAKLLTCLHHSFDRIALKQIRQFCEQCQKHRDSPGRFRFIIKDDRDFNYAITIDILYLAEPPSPVL